MASKLLQSTKHLRERMLEKYYPRYTSLFVLLMGALTVGLFSVACSDPHQAASLEDTDQNSMSDAADTEPITQLTLTANPSRDAIVQQVQLQELAAYLQSEIGIPIQIEMTETYEQTVDLLVEGKADLASLGVFSYLQARDRNPRLEPLVVPIAKSTGRPWYTSVIVVRANRGINIPEDLKGKRFGFLSRSSTSGFLVPSALFQKIGINPDQDFTRIQYSGGHDRSAQLLAAGDVDAIATDKQTYLRESNAGILTTQNYAVIWESDPIPNGPIVVSPNLPEPLKIELKKAFLNTTVEFVDANGAESSGYSIAEDSDYDTIRRLKAMLNP